MPVTISEVNGVASAGALEAPDVRLSALEKGAVR